MKAPSEIALPEMVAATAAMGALAIIVMGVLAKKVPPISAFATRSSWIEGLRGLAALAVALSHLPLLFSYAGNYAASTSANTFKVALGQLGVQIFFCITGFLFAGKLVFDPAGARTNWEAFFYNRVLRLVPAYLFACLIVVAIVARLTWKVPGSTSQLVEALPALLSFGVKNLQVNVGGIILYNLLGVNWSLAIEWGFYLFLPLLCVLFRRFGWAFVVGVLVVAFTVKSPCVPFFISGMAAAAMGQRTFGRAGQFVVAAVLAATLPLALRQETAQLYSFAQWLIVSAIFLALATLRPAVLCSAPLRALGTVSYSFYLLHLPLIFLGDVIARRFLTDQPDFTLPQLTFGAGAVLLAACLLATFSYCVIERPFLRRKRPDVLENPSAVMAIQPTPLSGGARVG